MTQPTPESYLWVTLLADESTPAEYTQYHGRVVALTPEQHAALPTSPTRGKLLGIPGTLTNATTWLMAGLLTSVITAVDGIPAANGTPAGWKSTADRAVYLQTARNLIQNQGLPANATVSALGSLYRSAVANHTTP